MFLFGGPSHVDLWDIKSDAPAEIRGQFKPISTRVPGIDLCEHLPLLAARSDLLCLVRLMTHTMAVHGPACSELCSGRPDFGPPTTDQAKPEDWPSLASIVERFGRKGEDWPPSIVLPWYTQFARQVYGERNNFGGYVKDKPVSPADLSATILHHLGIDPSHEHWDEFRQVMRKLSIGSPIENLG
jgi:hypothetical protein